MKSIFAGVMSLVIGAAPLIIEADDTSLPPGETMAELYWNHFPGAEEPGPHTKPYLPVTNAVSEVKMDFDRPIDPYHPGKISLRITYTGIDPLRLKLLPAEHYRQLGQGMAQEIHTHHFGITGEVSYENTASGVASLEILSHFAPATPESSETSYFTSMWVNGGVETHPSGHGDWRDFSLIFDGSQMDSTKVRLGPLDNLELDLNLTGPATVHLRNLKLVQYPDTATPVAAQSPAVPGGQPSIFPTERILTVGADSSMSIDGASYSSINALQPVLQAFQRTNQMLLIRAASNVPYNVIQQILDACKQAGLQRIGFATMKPTDATAASPNSSDQKTVWPKEVPLFISRRGGDGLEFRLGKQTYSSLADLVESLKNTFDSRHNSLTFYFNDDVDRDSLQKVSSALADIGISSVYLAPDNLQPRRTLDGKSFLLGVLSTCLLLLAAVGIRFALRRWHQLRHSRELRRIASLDT